MPFTPSLQNTWPVVNASASVWGGILNARGGETYTDMQAIATLLNATETKADAAMPKSGGAFTGAVTLHNSGPTSVQSPGWRGLPVRQIAGNDTLVLNDAGGMVRYGGTANVTVTIPPASSVGFPRGTAISLRNYSAGTMTVARGSGVELRAPLNVTNKNFTLAPHGWATILLEDTNMWVIQGSGAL